MSIVRITEPIEFEWDEGNVNKNRDKHSVTRQEAEQAFLDEDKFITKDLGHSEKEVRFILLGRTEKDRLLYIAFTLRKNKVRIISARDISKKKEVSLYEEAA